MKKVLGAMACVALLAISLAREDAGHTVGALKRTGV